MKKLILSVILVGGISAGVHAQGLIDIFSTSTSVFEVSGGHTNASPGVNLGIELWGGSSSSNLVLIADLPNIGIAGSPGQFFDTGPGSDGVGDWAVAGVGAGGTGFFQVYGWVGPDSVYPQGATGDLTGHTGVFTVANLGSSTSPAPNLSGMPALYLTAAPEPTTLALCGLGAASLLLLRRKK
jgi:hypothetical protein